MNREIKFRCFNEGTGKMIDLYQTTPLALDANLNCDGLFIPFKEGYKLMQFTGLQDKNGKDIYEDDWCRAEFRDKEGIHVVQGRIIMSEYMWCLDCTGTDVCPDIYSINRLHSFDLVSNVYESPELIDNK